MKTYISMLVAILATLFTTQAFAWNPPPSPKPASAISDVGGTLSPEAHARLDAQLTQINASSANELAALILPSLEGQSIEDVANATFKAWGVGKKDIDNGVLIVLAMKEHKSRIETGKGVEGDLPDLKTHDILDNVVRPRMKQHNVEAALRESFYAISTAIENHKAQAEAAKAKAAADPVPVPASPSKPICDVSDVGLGGGTWALLIMGMVALVIFMVRRMAARTPAQPEWDSVTSDDLEEVIPPPLPARPRPVAVSAPTVTPAPVSNGSDNTAALALAAATLAAEEAARRARVRREREEREEREAAAERRRLEREQEEEESRNYVAPSPSFTYTPASSSDDDSSSSSDDDNSSFGGGDSGGGGSTSSWDDDSSSSDTDSSNSDTDSSGYSSDDSSGGGSDDSSGSSSDW